MPSRHAAPSHLPLLLLLACAGTDDGSADDPADSDDSRPVDSDIGDTDARAAEVTVTVVGRDGRPMGGMPVIFHAPDGAVASTATTAADGSTRASVDAGGAVTIRDEAGGRLVTFTALAPGDEVRLAVDPGPLEGAAAVALAAHPDSDGYTVSSGCDSTSTSDPTAGVEVPYGAPCLHEGHFDLLAVAEAAGGWSAWTAELDVEADGDGTTDVALLAPWRTDWATAEVSIEGAPDGAWHFLGEIATFRHGVRFAADAPGADLVAGDAAVSPKVPDGFATETVVTGSLLLDVHYTARSQLLVRHPQAVPDAVVFEGADAPLPPSAGSSDDADPARPVITWSGATPLDAAALDVGYVHASGVGLWRLVLPGDATSVRLPALPDALAHLAPTEGASGRQVHFRAGAVEGVDATTLRLREADRLWTELLREGEAAARRAEIALLLE